MTQIKTHTGYTVDPQVYTPFDARDTVFGRRMWDAEASFYGADPHARALERIVEGEPGYSHLEYARSRAAWTVAEHFHGAYAWEPLDPPDGVLSQLGRYEVADRDEMTREILDTARTFGASLAGVAALDRRWVYSHTRSGQPVDVPEAYQYVIVMAIEMDAEAIATSPAYAAASATGVGYSRMAFAASCLAGFIRDLGYRAIPAGNDTALSIPLAIDAGLGELGRSGLLVTPEYGPCVRLCKVLTDLPLVPSAPAPFGVTETCRGCRLCAEACENGAIQDDPEPSYRVASRSNNAGILRWAVHHDKCYAFWIENGACCSTCIAACPYTHKKR